MTNLSDNLKELPPEFTMAMEEAKDKNFISSLEYILNKFNIIDEFNNIDKETKNEFIKFLKLLYIYGFYSGVNFSIKPYDFLNNKNEES